MMGIFVFVAASVLLAAALLTLERKFPCNCGRNDFWYFTPTHESGRLMLIYAIFFVINNTLWIITSLSVPSVLYGVPMTCWLVLRYWRHEKDKIKKALKGVGRVAVNEHGQLKVVQERG